MDWLSDNAALISAVISALMLVVWLLYLQIFYIQLQRQFRLNLLIHQGGGFDLNGLCIVVNLSNHPVHIAAVLVDAKDAGGSCTWQPVPNRQIGPDDERPLRHFLQGPLATGDYLTLGRFSDLVEEASDRFAVGTEARDLDEELELQIRVIAFVGPRSQPAGARRRFRIRLDEDGEVRPVTVLPEQMSSRRQRRQAKRWLEEAQRLEPDALLAPHARPSNGDDARGAA